MRNIVRSTTSRISEIVNLFESPAPPTSTPREDPGSAVRPSVSVKNIISKFDVRTPSEFHRSNTIGGRSQSRWVQVEKVVEGKPVGQVWLRRNSSALLDTAPPPLPESGSLTERKPPRPHENETACESETPSTPYRNDNDYNDENSGTEDPKKGDLVREDDAQPPQSGGSRASHFIAFRIDDADVVDRLVAFQDAVCTLNPFLDVGRTNPEKFHLTLLVLSLKPGEVSRAIQAMNAAIATFRRRINEILELEFRTVGAFSTRLLFVAPPLRQRLLLDALHVDLARSCGEHGLTIVGAGAAWTSAMALRHKLQANGVGMTTNMLHAAKEDGDDYVWDNPPDKSFVPAYTPTFEPSSSVSNGPTSDWLHTDIVSPCRDQADSEESSAFSTSLDRTLLKKYDISGYRNTLYVPQISVFKMGKANRKGKKEKVKIKLHPRMYHSIVQQILASDDCPKRVVTTSMAPQPPFGKQVCNTIELVEMSLGDPDGYYKRLHSISLVPPA